MVLSGPSTPISGTQSVSPSLLQSNSGILGVQGGLLPSQTGFSPLLSSRTQFTNMNMLGNVPNMSSLLNQSFGNGGPNSGFSGSGNGQRGSIDISAEVDPLSRLSFNNASPSFVTSNMANPVSSGQGQIPQVSSLSSSQILTDQQHSQQLDSQAFQLGQHSSQPFASPIIIQQQQQLQQNRGNLGGFGPVNIEPQMSNLSAVKLEPQQLPPARSLVSVKMEPQYSDPSLFLYQQKQQLQQQQQQQQFILSRQSPQLNLSHHQRLVQQQQQQQQQPMKVRPQVSQQFQQQNLPLRSNVKAGYEPGMCAKRLTHYIYHQHRRPEDNNIEFWRQFVAEYFAPQAKKKWCVSTYGSGRQACGQPTAGVHPLDAWHCEICNRKPGRGFEATVEVLPRLFKIKYESGTLEELLYVDLPHEYHNSSGQIVLDYAKAIQESVFEQLRVVRDGQLRIVFSPELKICSWEFCAWRHEELLPRRLLIPQVSQVGAAAQKYQAAVQNASSNLSTSELQNNCNMFLSSAQQLAKAVEASLVNDLGYTKRFVRCLQISEVVNSMKDLIDYSRETGTRPMESLAKFPRRTSAAFGIQKQAGEQQPQQQTMAQNSSPHQTSPVQDSSMQITSTNGVTSVNNPINPVPTSNASTIAGLLHRNSINSRQQNSSIHNGNPVQNSHHSSSSTIPQQAQQTPSASPNNPPLPPHTAANSPATISPQQPALSTEADPIGGGESQSSVQRILQEMMMSGPLNRTSTVVGVNKNMNGVFSASNMTGLNGGGLVGNEYRAMGGGLGQTSMGNGLRSVMGNNNTIINGRLGMASLARDQSISNNNNHNHQQQEDLENNQAHKHKGRGVVNGFNNNLQFDWKPSP